VIKKSPERVKEDKAKLEREQWKLKMLEDRNKMKKDMAKKA